MEFCPSPTESCLEQVLFSPGHISVKRPYNASFLPFVCAMQHPAPPPPPGPSAGNNDMNSLPSRTDDRHKEDRTQEQAHLLLAEPHYQLAAWTTFPCPVGTLTTRKADQSLGPRFY